MTGIRLPQSEHTSRARRKCPSSARIAVSRATDLRSMLSAVESQVSQYAFGDVLRRNVAMRPGLDMARPYHARHADPAMAGTVPGAGDLTLRRREGLWCRHEEAAAVVNALADHA
jgi:hypothetical protein